ncbi:MAG: DUF2934 domain-containing protein [Rhodocyclales bacterium]|nr:DUF2934 domain-containing protein [Rhodocyclales bacterium]
MTEAKKASRTSAGKRTAGTATTAAGKAASVKKAAPAKAAPPAKAKATAAAKPVRSRTTKVAAIPLEQRRNYVEVAAYYIAAARSFTPGDPLQDWIQAEAEIDRLLKEGRLGVLPP